MRAIVRLLRKLKKVRESEEYKSVWYHWQNHYGEYKGPTYKKEYDEAINLDYLEESKLFILDELDTRIQTARQESAKNVQARIRGEITQEALAALNTFYEETILDLQHTYSKVKAL